MIMTSTSIGRGPRPRAVVAVCAAPGFVGLGALGGGIALSLGGAGAPPRGWLGGRSHHRRLARARPSAGTGHHWSYAATVLIGLGPVAWIGLDVTYLPELFVWQIVYGAVGVALIALPALTSLIISAHSEGG
jgi:hypothetical protein